MGSSKRKKEWKIVITFCSTADAMAVERFCKENHLPGRLIPVPRSITADCGLAWMAQAAEEEALREKFEKNRITVDNYYRLELY